MNNVNKIICGDWIEQLRLMPDGYFHCCITSPPYWGQRLYGWGGDGSCDEKEVPHKWEKGITVQACVNCGMKAPTFGLEETPEEHIAKLVEGFGEVRRVLRDDGVLFLNYGDKYNSSPAGNLRANTGCIDYQRDISTTGKHMVAVKSLEQGDLIGLPWRLGLALQADGWILRSDIIWAKAVSFCDTYSGSTMPESVSGCRWEQHRVKVKSGNRGKEKQRKGSTPERPQQDHNGKDFQPSAQYKDCPGCPKCEKNDGLVLRYGSWRPTRAHEYLLMLVKGPRYFCDMEAVREAIQEASRERCRAGFKQTKRDEKTTYGNGFQRGKGYELSAFGRNLRDVWAINPQPYPEAHYATFPEALVRPCIKAATSAKGCCGKCGAQWAPVVEKGSLKEHPARANRNVRNKAGYDGQDYARRENTLGLTRDTTTLGFRPTCGCSEQETVPSRVLDPFCGSGTTLAEAAKLGRDYTGIEINPDYIANQAMPRVNQGETGITPAELKAGQMAIKF